MNQSLQEINLETARAQLIDLFDPTLYRAQARLNKHTDAFTHYFQQGAALRPNVIFDPDFYRAPDGACPLLHYALIGEAANSNPSALFDVAWYRRAYGAAHPLAHYLANRFGPFSPNPDFDAAYYLAAYPDVAAAGMDPLQHYITFGFLDFRKPSPHLNPKLYVNRHMVNERAGNPLVHLRTKGMRSAARIADPYEAARVYAQPGRPYESATATAPGEPQVLALAFYLPQFHRIPENDDWWGEGFTEWRLVARGQSRFAGHYQPRIPGALGFYDLTNPEVLRAQSKLAKAAGIGGFVFYHYDFGGKRLLERPVELFLKTPEIDMRFCLMWANENWTRRWDGAQHELLIAQDYDSAHEPDRLAEFARHFRDSRYLRLQGRPLLMIYRGSLIPDAAATLTRWRRLFAAIHGENPVFIMAQTFDDLDPRPLGFDAAIEFPPHKLTRRLSQVFAALDVHDPDFEADVFAYDDVVAASLTQAEPDFPLIETAVPSWDNDARRQGQGLTLAGATPLKFQRWLAGLIRRARPFLGARIVAINAWNEWSEGAYLEPDVHLGAANLNAAQRALFGLSAPKAQLTVADRTSEPEAAARHLAARFGVALVAPGAAPNVHTKQVASFELTDAEIAFMETALRGGQVAETGTVYRALFDKFWPLTPKVSIFLLHNGEVFSPLRLRSIFEQTYPVWEIVVLSSSADLVDVVEAEARVADRDVSLYLGVVAGLQTAALLATGDLIWILDSHGSSDPTALATLAGPLAADPSVAFSFAESTAADEADYPIYVPPLPIAQVNRPALYNDRAFSGADFLTQISSAPALSAMLWRREALDRALAVHPGDSLALCRAAASAPNARVFYLAETINFERLSNNIRD